MKFQADLTNNTATVQAYGEDWVNINGQIHRSSVLVSSSGQQQAWSASQFETLNADAFAQTLTLGAEPPELVVFGFGTRTRFPKPEWLQSLMSARIGLEAMDLGAACRTFNILSGEGRRVVLAVLIEAPAKV